ncbi:MAG: hypothetical protein GYB31_02100 [Bacteroidetes bacterium]|nr:hypothetical protein [Bacteroidota bacterium]
MSKVLLELPGSEERLPMHLGVEGFLVDATADEKSYFRFASIRNPMDSVVSAYYKKKMDHNGRFSRGTFKKGKPIAPQALEEYRFIVEHDADFATYFAAFFTEEYRRPKHENTVAAMNDLIRFENLQSDFERICKALSMPRMEVPHYNKTAGRKRDFIHLYTPAIRRKAKKVFGPIMNDWGYEFPEDWQAVTD